MSDKVRIIYKSGAEQVFKCDEFKVKFSPAHGITEVTWTNANPRPLYIGVDDIAAIYNLT